MNLIDGNKIVVIKDRAFTLKTISDIYVFDNMLYVHCFNGDIAKIKLDKVSDFRLFKDVVDEVFAYHQALNGLVMCER
jgi:hypothetical protein|nr:MAG TPA: hypothetical protein [Bacteriophage sp.]